MKYRSRTDIIAAILKISTGGATKTRIMYGAFLSYAQIKEYLAFLQEKGLLWREEGTQLYKLTQRGMEFLHQYETVVSFISLDSPSKK